MKAGPPLSFNCGAGWTSWPYAPDSDTVHLCQAHWCSSQSGMFNTMALQNGGYCGCMH